jgi:anti-sigma factor RsiW
MSDIHALSGAYAVDALDDAERIGFEEHLAQCAACRAEVASFRETSALVAETEAVTPPSSLRDGVLAGISQIRPLPPETPPAPMGPAEPTDELAVRRRRLPAILATAAAVVLLAVGAVLWHPWQQGASVTDQVLQAPDAVRTTQPVAGGGELTLVRSASLDRAVMLSKGVPDPEAGTTYQLWLQQNGQMVSAGLMPDAGSPTLLMGDPGTATAAAVTVEPDGGSQKPTSDPIALFTFASGQSGDGSA